MMTGGEAETTLAALRQEIDRIDEGMHRLLMERGRIIDRLIAIKGTAASGSAFRPEREAAMMRVLAARHEGPLPFDAPEGLWRVIISTFTHVQAPFSVHLDLAGEEAAMRDSARFHFGFTVPLVPHGSAAEAVAAVAASRGDLALVEPGVAPGAWWRVLEAPDAPKVIARLPFTDRLGHPAATPVLVISRMVSGEGWGAVRLYAAAERGTDAVAGSGAALVASRDGYLLLAAPAGLDQERLEARLGPLVPVGSHPETVRMPATHPD